ncbi:GCN5-related N-acetyltransferase [Methanohalophilus mahii DSM 5219]|uniref:GCN5-related N-acetyltransferase n=2 Tax=Methanohalophilus mahii TaxID=2176 RepID=D5E7U6_METMS|nr:GCN5-related N-acetyltransferase [Methanohalophilus mahii DSM 5219]
MHITQDITICQAVPDDRAAIDSLLCTYFLDGKDLDTGDFLLAKVDDRIVGTVAFVRDNFEEIHSVAVHPSFRKKGIGALLVSSALQLSLSSAVYARTTAKSFFSKSGFVEVISPSREELWDDCACCEYLENCNQHVMVWRRE